VPKKQTSPCLVVRLHLGSTTALAAALAAALTEALAAALVAALVAALAIVQGKAKIGGLRAVHASGKVHYSVD
jgi:hypothetical protein